MWFRLFDQSDFGEYMYKFSNSNYDFMGLIVATFCIDIEVKVRAADHSPLGFPKTTH